MFHKRAGANHLTRHARRLMVVAAQTSRNRGQRETYRNAVRQLKANGAAHSDAEAPVAPRASRRHAPRYDDVEAMTGDSIVQTRFDALVKAALLQYGPPLPPEFALNNGVVTSSSPAYSSTSGRKAGFSGSAAATSGDDGADGTSFVFYDEVPLKSHELLSIIRKHTPGFSIKEDCDGVPFALLVKNCCYLRAYGGRIHYMRYLRKNEEKDRAGRPTLILSISKYKMREAPSFDGIRTGPQPWKYSAKTL